ncbi:MAG: DMT family transporter [Oscillospiraceae bacterium]|nr:DMT family transporter [Oscillospiraceae bacterium]
MMKKDGRDNQMAGRDNHKADRDNQKVGRDNQMAGRAQTVALLVASGFLWSLGGVFIKTTDAHPMVISYARSLTASLCMLAYLRGRPHFVFTRAQCLGALCYAATVTSFVTATKLTTSANAILLQYSSPVFAVILGYLLLKDSLYWYDYLSMGGVSVGLVFLFSGSIGFGSMAGNVVAVFSGLFFGSFMVFLKMHKTGSQVETIILGNLVAVVIGIPFAVLYPVELSALPPVIFLGAFQIALPYILFAKASVRASTLDLALIPIIEPLLNPVWVYLATGERPAPLTYVGGAVLLGVISFRSVIMLRASGNAAPECEK